MNNIQENNCTILDPSSSIGPKTLNKSFIPVRVGSYKSSETYSKTFSQMRKKSETPKIPFDKVIQLKKVKDEQKQFAENQSESVRKMGMIKEQLTEIKVKIESMSKEQQSLNERISTCQDCGQMLKLARQKSEEHRNIMKFIKLEEKLTEELNKTQRSVCETGVAEQTFALQVEKEFNEINTSYETHKDILSRNRILREKRNEKNARAVHKRTVNEVLNSLKNANKMNTKKVQNEKIHNVKTARSKCEKYIRKTMQFRKEQNEQMRYDKQKRLLRQEKLLSQLKSEIDKQKDILWVEHKIRQRKLHKEAEEREARRIEMLTAGENPYIYEKMQAAAEKAKLMKKQIEDEKQNVKKLVAGMEEMSQDKQKEQMKKKKWESVWAKRLEEKKQKDKKSKRKTYGFDRESRLEIAKNPIQFYPKNTNMKICMIKHNYQELIAVEHKYRECGHVKAVIPHCLKPYVNVFPKELTVFKNKPSHFSVKFRPLLKIFEDTKIQKFFDPKTQIIDFPVNFHLQFPFLVPSPVQITFLGVVTDTKMEISPTNIELGKCNTIETVKSVITINNRTMIPQKIGFMEVPSCITVQPNFGFMTLLPYETRQVDLLFSAPETMDGKRNFRIKLLSLQDDEYIINLKAFVEAGTVQLSSNKIMFPATSCGCVVSTHLKVFSSIPKLKTATRSVLTSKYVFKIDDHWPIEVRPQAGMIEPGNTVKIFVSYKAGVDKDDIKARVIQAMENKFIANKGQLSFELESVSNKIEMLRQKDTERESMLAEKRLRRNSSRRRSSKMEKVIERKSMESGDPVEMEEYVGENEDEHEEYLEALPMPILPDNIPNKVKKVKNGKGKQNSGTSKKADNKNVEESHKRKNGKSEKTNSQNENDSTHQTRSRGNSKRDTLKITRSQSITYEPNPEILVLEQRREQLTELLNENFEPPPIRSISVSSDEYKKAEMEMMQHIVPTSKMYTIPCYIYDSDKNYSVLLLSVKCAMLPPTLVLLDPSPILNFGNVCLGSTVVKELTFANLGKKSIVLKSDVLNPYGPFVRCNALRRLSMDGTFKLRIRYKPTELCESEECVRVYGSDCNIFVTLKGNCVLPHLRIFPTRKDIFIGKLEPQSLGTYQFVVENPSEAELIVTVKLTLTGILENEVEIDMGESELSDEVVSAPPNSAIIPISPPPRREKKSSYNSGSRDSNPDHATDKPLGRNKRSADKGTYTDRLDSIATPATPATPPPFVGPFLITQGGVEKEVHLMEMLSILEEQKKDVFFQVVPSKFTVQSGETQTFVVYFIPFSHGRFFGNFEVSVLNHVVHEFSALGMSTSR